MKKKFQETWGIDSHCKIKGLQEYALYVGENREVSIKDTAKDVSSMIFRRTERGYTFNSPG